MTDYISRAETEIKFLSADKPNEFQDVQNFGTIQQYRDERNKTYWERISVGGSVTAEPVIHNGIIYIGTCDKNFYALTFNGRLKWKFPTNGTIQANALVYDNSVYFGSSDNNLYCVDAEKGELKWKFESTNRVLGTPVEHNGRIYFGSADGNLYVIDASSGEKIWVFSTPYPLVRPLIKDDKIYVGFEGSCLYCLNLEGELLWKFNTNGWITPTASENNNIYFGSEDKNMYAINSDGQLEWKYKAKDRTLCPSVKDGKIYFGCGDNKVYCIDSEGNRVWDFNANGTVINITIDGDVLYFGSYDNNLYALDRNSGEKLWRFKTNGFVTGNPAVHEDLIVFGSWDCNIYCITIEGQLIWKYQTSLSSQSAIEAPEQIETTKSELVMKIETKQGEKERAYKTDDIDGGSYEMNFTSYASGMNKTYISSKKRGYIGESEKTEYKGN